jgi:CRISPR-associated protein Csx17
MKITLSGCAPIPLAHYLKALAILRLVTDADSGAAAFWSVDQFCLFSKFDEDQLVAFFLNDYQPTPVINPWNGDGGFFEDSRAGAVEILNMISTSSSDRLASYRITIRTVRTAFERYGISEKPTDAAKALVLTALRNSLPENALGWLDAVCAFTETGPKYPPLLGSGGNDGSIDFSKNFMQRLTKVMDIATGTATANSERWLRAALFNTTFAGSTTGDKIGQFFPGAAGGANSTSGFNAEPMVNPWDYVLMIEGAMLFAAASVKRLESTNAGALVYPFCVRQAGVGYASASTADEKDSRCEIWLPLWARPTSLAELSAVFGEGRAQVRGRPALNGVDFAQAAVTLGVDRGLSAFHRYGFQTRNGLSTFATPLERIAIRYNARADLLADIDPWLERLRQKAGPQANPEAPASVSRALNQLERSVLDLCRDNSPDRLQAVLIALGQTEKALARSFKWATGDNAQLRPLHHLNPAWLEKARTDSVEFRLAAALAGSRAWLGKETLWLRQHLEPLDMGANAERAWANWAKLPSNDVVWHEGDLTNALNAILARRIIRVQKSGARGWPDWSPHTAPLDDITQFIEGRTDDALLADLLWALSLIDWEKIVREEHATWLETENRRETSTPPDDAPHRAVPSSLYALLRLCFQRASGNDPAIPLVPAIHLRAAQGQGEAASELAARRLRGSGYAPLVACIPVNGEPARRTAAALLFPINPRDFRLLENTILHQPETTNP